MIAFLVILGIQSFGLYAIVLIIAYIVQHEQSFPNAAVALARDMYYHPFVVLFSIWVTGCALTIVRMAAERSLDEDAAD